MEVYLIRHTTPVFEKGLIYGRLDIPLADTFKEEKNNVLTALPQKIDKVFSSPSSRCRVLAEEISKDYIIDDRLLEYNFGEWEGRNWETNQSQEVNNWMSDYVNVCPPNGETLFEMQTRVLAFWNNLIIKPVEVAEETKVGVVTHGGVIRIIMSYIQQSELKNIFNIKINYGEVIFFKDGILKGIVK